ncbi:LCP family protein [Glycomyces dulcitolivorans]|uniref:LCP family protein n=1 Tax=Glycomyces dulcitolivorans TaxID=2200759 RepID=UPI000DD36044|nr:LCP family protein [Glycomyces dulcitolivorans]
MAGKSGAPWWAHFMMYAGGVTLVVAGATAGFAQYAISTADDTIPQENILDEYQAEMDVENIEGPLNILVLGVDKQGGSTRSDTMIIVHVNKGLTEATMVSLPRDLLVDIPDCGPGFSGNPCQNKLNHAASISDDWDVTKGNVVATVHDLTGLDFHLGATADFNGFVEMVDLVGGVEICTWKEFQSHHTDRVFEEGCHEYDKEAALDLVRQRYQFYDQIDYDLGLYGDYARQNFQQQAIKSLLVKAKEQGFLEDPGKITDLLEGFDGKVTLDRPEDLSIADLVVNLRDIDPNAMTTVRVPASSEQGTDWGDVELIHEGAEAEAAESLWAALQDDTMAAWIAANPEWVKSDAADPDAVDPGESASPAAD